jgi:hypothetical protein
LWVDGLFKLIPFDTLAMLTGACVTGIVRYDPEELAQEIGSQARICQNREVTILAAGAAKANEGFLSHRTRESLRYNVSIQLPNGKCQSILVELDYIPKPDPVDSRAWILQEGKTNHILLGWA